jgi:hypothetical protein
MDTSERFEKLEKRLNRTERYNRLLLVVVLLAGVVLALGAVKNEKVVTANAFHVVDEKGNIRAAMSMGRGNPAFTLYDEKGNKRIAMSLGRDYPMFRLYDENGKTRASLLVFAGYPVFTLYDKEGMRRAALGAMRTNEPHGITNFYPESSLFLFDQFGEVIWEPKAQQPY